MAQDSTTLKNAGADFDAVMKQMAVLRDDLAKVAHSVQSIAGARGHAIAHDMTEGVNDAASYLARKGHDADKRIEGAVAANPYIALALATGLGLLLGVLTRR